MQEKRAPFEELFQIYFFLFCYLKKSKLHFFLFTKLDSTYSASSQSTICFLYLNLEHFHQFHYLDVIPTDSLSVTGFVQELVLLQKATLNFECCELEKPFKATVAESSPYGNTVIADFCCRTNNKKMETRVF